MLAAMSKGFEEGSRGRSNVQKQTSVAKADLASLESANTPRNWALEVWNPPQKPHGGF